MALSNLVSSISLNVTKAEFTPTEIRRFVSVCVHLSLSVAPQIP